MLQLNSLHRSDSVYMAPPFLVDNEQRVDDAMLRWCKKLTRRLSSRYVILTSSYLDLGGTYDNSNEQIKLFHSSLANVL